MMEPIFNLLPPAGSAGEPDLSCTTKHKASPPSKKEDPRVYVVSLSLCVCVCVCVCVRARVCVYLGRPHLFDARV